MQPLKVKNELLFFCLIPGIVISFAIKNRFTFFFFNAKNFEGRSWYYQIAILLFLIVSISVLLYFLVLVIISYVTKHEKFYRCLRAINQKGVMIICIGVAVYATMIAVRFSHQPLLEAHSFRQTQTAVTAYWMLHDGWKLAYQTPVVGYPWSIPFEFPIFQSIVALFTWLSGFQLDYVGRLVSFFFLIACVWPAFKISRKLKLPFEVPWIFCALLWSSPIYLFWGRTFMIETAALFFTLASIPYALDLLNSSPSWRSVSFFAFWGALGMLQKITTAAPVILVMGVVVLISHLKTTGFKLPSWRKFAGVIVAFVIPVLIGLLWSKYSDQVKAQNLMGFFLTSKALTSWNFGTIQQHFDLNILKVIFWDRVFVDNAAGYFGIFLIASVLLIGNRRERIIVLTSLLLFTLPIFIFINLHYIHTYYQVSSTLFLLGALAIATVVISSKIREKSTITSAITLILVFFNLYSFSNGYKNNVQSVINITNNTTLAVSDVIRRYTPENSNIVVFGDDWSSKIAYYSERKAFTVPSWFPEIDQVFANPASFFGGDELGAIVFCGSDNAQSLSIMKEQPNVKLQPMLFLFDKCYLWMPRVDANMQTLNNKMLKPIDSSIS